MIPDDPDKFVPHGFMTLELDGPALTERVFLSNGEELLSNRIVCESSGSRNPAEAGSSRKVKLDSHGSCVVRIRLQAD